MTDHIQEKKWWGKLGKDFLLPLGIALFIFVVSFPLLNMIHLPLAAGVAISFIAAFVVWKVFRHSHQHR